MREVHGSHPDEDDPVPDQSPTRPTLGAAVGRAQLAGKGSAGSPPKVRPTPEESFPLSDIVGYKCKY